MALQDPDRLLIDGLSILGDPRPNSAQPPLDDAIHLRWSFGPDAAFPPHGYYLFRRGYPDVGERCTAAFLARLDPRRIRGRRLETPYGTFTGDPLVAIDEFEPPGAAELSLANGLTFMLPPNEWTRRATARIGFRNWTTTKKRTSVDFRTMRQGEGPNPRVEQGIRFEVSTPGARASVTRVHALGSSVGLDCGRQLTITFPPGASNLQLSVFRRGAPAPFVLRGVTRSGSTFENVATADGFIGFGVQANVVIDRVTLESPGEAVLFELSVDVESAPPEIVLTGFSGTNTVASATVRGAPRTIVATELVGNGITSIRISGGPAALLDLCYSTCLSQFLTRIPPGPMQESIVRSPFGVLSGPAMVAADDFEPKGVAEIALAGEAVRFTLPDGVTTRWARVRLGFRPPGPKLSRIGVDFRKRPPGDGMNPLVDSTGTRFDVRDATMFRLTDSPHGVGLVCNRRLVITLPPGAMSLSLTFRRRGQDPPVIVKAYMEDGKLALERPLPEDGEVGLGIQGGLVLRTIVIESTAETLLHEVSWGTKPKPPEVTITPHAGRSQLPGVTVRGTAGQIVTTDVTGIGITAIHIGRGDAALIDICYVAEKAGLPAGPPGPWMFVPSFVYPLTLPITHPAYPASAGAEALAARRGPAALRIRYGPATDALPPPQRTLATGTITLRPGSALAKGQGTAWTDALVGSLLYPSSSDTAFAVMTVLAPDRLVLSRPFTGTQMLQNVAYDVAPEDAFAQVHDQIAGLLSAPDGMRAAQMPPVLESSAPGRDVFLIDGADVVQGMGTSWTADVVGLLLEIGPSADVYRIVGINTAAQQLTLHAKYFGTSGMAPYRIVSRSPNNRIEEGPALAIPPLDLLELAALSPAYAQLLGLYWVDRSAESGRTYDYIVVADHEGRFHRNAAEAHAFVNGAADFSGTGVDGAILTAITHSGSGALPAPASMQAFALPAGRLGATIDRVDLADSDPALSVTDLASWSQLPAASRPLMLDVWRVALGTQTPADGSPRAATDHVRIGDRVLPQLRTSNPSDPRPPGWPDPASIHFLDGDGGGGLDVGWYSYRVSAVDLWGRMSELSPPIPWHDVATGVKAHSHAVHLEDRIPPPPPTDLVAWVLEPENVPGTARDPSLVKDAAYDAWRQKIGASARGLRLQFRWPWSHQLRAPDLQEFRVYAQPTPINARLHRIVSVAPVAGDATHSDVTLAAGDSLGPNAYAGAALQASKRAFAIHSSTGGTQLVLRVKNGGPTGGEPPIPGVDATIVIEAGHPLHRELLDPLEWKHFLAPFAATSPSIATIRYDVDALEDPAALVFDDPQNPLHGVAADWDGARVRIDDAPSQPLLSTVRPGIDVIALGHDASGRFAILGIASVDAVQGIVHPAAPVPDWLDAETYRWAIGPQTQDARGIHAQWNAGARRLDLAGQPDLSRVRPGIDKVYVKSGPASTPENLDDFFDIEQVDIVQRRLVLRGAVASLTNGQTYAWRIGRPVRIYEVFLPTDAAGSHDPQLDLWMKPSLAEPIVYATVGVSAADKRTERPDLRPNRTPALPGNEGFLAGPATIFRVQREIPDAPADDAWNASRLWATRADYHGKSYFTVRWEKPPAAKLPYYKAVVLRAVDETLFEVDFHLDPPRAFPLTQTVLDQATPSHWTPSRKAAVATEFIGATSTYETIRAKTDFALAQPLYRALTDDALSVLANLPGNDDAFAQISITALDLTDPANEDRRGPDDDLATFPGVNATLNATLDELDGRSQNRYLYKVAFVDPANNRGPLGKASPAVYLPKVVPPRAPIITKILGGDRQITLKWAANREPDLAGYRIYRTEDEARAAEIRRMDLVQSANPTDVEWTDTTNLIPGRKYFYRLTAFDTSDNESKPTRIYPGIAVDTRVPPAPEWTEQTWLLRRAWDGSLVDWPADNAIPPGYKPVLRLGLHTETAEPQFVLTRWRTDRPNWLQSSAAGIRPSDVGASLFELVDEDVDPNVGIAYRLKVRSRSGVWSTELAFLSVTPPASITPPAPEES